MSQRWLQIRGDPSIRCFLFNQSRVSNEFDNHIDRVIALATRLLRERGMFHAKLHFSSGQVTLWALNDPCNYQVWLKEEFLAPGFGRRFRKSPYPINAVVPPYRVHEVLALFRPLRLTDESLYLRSGSLNIINGTVGLNFSCDGSHYIDYRDFLSRYRDINL